MTYGSEYCCARADKQADQQVDVAVCARRSTKKFVGERLAQAAWAGAGKQAFSVDTPSKLAVCP